MKETIHISGNTTSEIDVAVLLIFFTRKEQTVKTFEQIRKARPSRLYLYQDGPRINKHDDINNILECRNAIENMIDWECDVYKFYQEKNFGCDPSEYISQKWMFSIETKGIVIEDDDVMSVSFFRFCKELLDKYEFDTRVNMICGMNHLGIYDCCPYDYFFTQGGGAIWGWASWRRVIDQWDPNYSLLEDKYTLKLLKANIGSARLKAFLSTCKHHKETGREHYESIFGYNRYINSTFNIVPSKNMTCNIGIAAESTHSVSNLNLLPKKVRGQLYMKTYELEFPLKHPKCLIDEKIYKHKLDELLGGKWYERLFHTRKIESLIYRISASIVKDHK